MISWDALRLKGGKQVSSIEWLPCHGDLGGDGSTEKGEGSFTSVNVKMSWKWQREVDVHWYSLSFPFLSNKTSEFQLAAQLLFLQPTVALRLNSG